MTETSETEVAIEVFQALVSALEYIEGESNARRFVLLLELLGLNYGEEFDIRMYNANGSAGEDECGDGFVTGNWNPKRFPRNGEPPLTFDEQLPELLCDVVEKWDLGGGWSDEYTECEGCYKAFRTSPSSMWWEPEFPYFAGEGMFCNHCSGDI